MAIDEKERGRLWASCLSALTYRPLCKMSRAELSAPAFNGNCFSVSHTSRYCGPLSGRVSVHPWSILRRLLVSLP